MFRPSRILVIVIIASSLFNRTYQWTTDSDRGKISIKISKVLPSISPSEARDAFVEYTWKKGGGLPVGVINLSEKDRILFPFLATDELVEDYKTDPSVKILRYYLRKLGPIWKTEIIGNSHLGTVTFCMHDNTSTSLTWEVEFMTTRNYRLWKFITERMIEEALCNLQSYCAIPLVLTHRVEIHTDLSIGDLTKQWIQYIWMKGGGLPLPLPPLPLSLDYYTRMIVPPFLVEQIRSVNDTTIIYTVNNPSILTYQVHSHSGNVHFESITDTAHVMWWQVNIKPFNGWTIFVVSFTEAIINTLSKNFVSHIHDLDTSS